MQTKCYFTRENASSKIPLDDPDYGQKIQWKVKTVGASKIENIDSKIKEIIEVAKSKGDKSDFYRIVGSDKYKFMDHDFVVKNDSWLPKDSIFVEGDQIVSRIWIM